MLLNQQTPKSPKGGLKVKKIGGGCLKIFLTTKVAKGKRKGRKDKGLILISLRALRKILAFL
jgi:hypothetical protein